MIIPAGKSLFVFRNPSFSVAVLEPIDSLTRNPGKPTLMANQLLYPSLWPPHEAPMGAAGGGVGGRGACQLAAADAMEIQHTTEN